MLPDTLPIREFFFARRSATPTKALLLACLVGGFLLAAAKSPAQEQSSGSASLSQELAGLSANLVQATQKEKEAQGQLKSARREYNRVRSEPPPPGASSSVIRRRNARLAELRQRVKAREANWARAANERQRQATAVNQFIRVNPNVRLPNRPANTQPNSSPNGSPAAIPNVNLGRMRQVLENLKKGGINFDGSRDYPSHRHIPGPGRSNDPLPVTRPRAANTGTYRQQARRQQQSVPAGLPPRQRMQRLQRVSPFRSGVGGVAVGNAPRQAPIPKSARFVLERGFVSIEVNVQGKYGKFVFADMTPTELWSAYHFLRPNNKQRSLGAKPGLLGLVGIAKNNIHKDGSWDFGVHPALANTVLASDAMRLDMVLTLGDPRLPRIAGGWSTYLWYDEAAVISARNGKISLKAATQPEHTLMRVKLWGRDKAIPFNMNPVVVKLFERFDGLRSIDRFARIVAVLNWLDAAGKLPTIPDEVRPLQFDLPSKCYLTDVSYPGAKIFRGQLTKSDPFDRIRRGRHHKVHRLHLEAGKTYTVELQSDVFVSGGKLRHAFDPYLRIENSAGTNLAQNDDGGGYPNSRLIFRPRQSGDYRLIATSYPSGATGAYFLKVWEGRPSR